MVETYEYTATRVVGGEDIQLSKMYSNPHLLLQPWVCHQALECLPLAGLCLQQAANQCDAARAGAGWEGTHAAGQHVVDRVSQVVGMRWVL